MKNTKSLSIKSTNWLYFTQKIVSYQMQLVSGPNKAFLRILNFDLDIWPWKISRKNWRHIFLKSSSRIGLETLRLQQLTGVSHGPPIFLHKLPDYNERRYFKNVRTLINYRLCSCKAFRNQKVMFSTKFISDLTCHKYFVVVVSTNHKIGTWRSLGIYLNRNEIIALQSWKSRYLFAVSIWPLTEWQNPC